MATVALRAAFRDFIRRGAATPVASRARDRFEDADAASIDRGERFTAALLTLTRVTRKFF